MVFSQAFDSLVNRNNPTPEQVLLLLSADGSAPTELATAARELTERIHGKKVFLRGLLEISNRCRNNCYYCGIRADNSGLERYLLSRDEILEAARKAYSIGFRTLVLQAGEWPASDAIISEVVELISTEMPDVAVTLSLGEREASVYKMWKDCGATRYLLRHETASSGLYGRLHPKRMSLRSRINCLHELKALGYQVGAGMMVGSPGQTIEDLVEDIIFLRDFRPQMVGMGPFIPHSATPFANEPAGSIDISVRVLSIVRLLLPYANIPSTTALASLSPDGRERGILAGANVVMPNVSPVSVREFYTLYNGKKSSGEEATEGIRQLQDGLRKIDRIVDFSRGDYVGPP